MRWLFVIVGVVCAAIAIVAVFELVHQMELSQWAHNFDKIAH